MNVAVIGGGAAGFFAALAVKENHPKARVVIFEKSEKLLAKVKVSGGGRCNVTNSCSSISELLKAYPRGGKRLKKPFNVFSNLDTVNWFAQRGVKLVAEADGRMFPDSNKSQTIINCLMDEAEGLSIEIKTGTKVLSIEPNQEGLKLSIKGEKVEEHQFDRVIVTTGGSPKREGFDWLAKLGHQIAPPVPSLFTFNMPGNPVTRLMGVVVPGARVAIQGTKLKSEGPLLITHWGMSGPAILKLSAFGARLLSEQHYDFKVQVNWIGEVNHDLVMEKLRLVVEANMKKLITNYRPFGLPEKLWLFLIEKAGLKPTARWGDLGKKGLNKLVNLLTNDVYAVKGKTTFKEEFVTSGGVSLDSIDLSTMQSRACANLYFAGEVLDIDAITGGYNFQAAWTTGYIAGKLA